MCPTRYLDETYLDCAALTNRINAMLTLNRNARYSYGELKRILQQQGFVFIDAQLEKAMRNLIERLHIVCENGYYRHCSAGEREFRERNRPDAARRGLLA